MIKVMLAFALATAGYASAHSGDHHDSMLATLMHLLSEPDHLALAVGAVIVGALGARLLHRRGKPSRPPFGDR
jgi:hydrogenase/urease accessory protein HupE